MTAQDADGTVWGVARAPAGLIYRWQSDHWAVAPGTLRPGFPLGIWPGPGGGIVIVWTPTPNGSPITWRRGDQNKLLGYVPNTFDPRVFPAPLDSIWITGRDAKIYRLAQDGTGRLAYTFPHSPYRAVRSPGQAVVYPPLQAAPDGLGRTWFWANSPGGSRAWIVLPGFAIYNGQTFEYHRTIDGLPDGGVTFLGRADDTHLWAGVFRQGLYSIDITKLAAQRVPEPEPSAFDDVTKIFRDGQDTYLVEQTRTPNAVETPGHRLTSVLWRLHDGRWQKLLAGIDDAPRAGFAWQRPWLAAAPTGGMWLGSYAAGLWFVPPGDASPELVDWRQGLPLDSVDRLYPLGSGHILAVQFQTGIQDQPSRSVAFDAPMVLRAAAPAKDIRVLDPYTPFEADRQHRIWGLRTVSSHALSEWDGAKWVTHALPAGVDPKWLIGADADEKGRIWLFPGCMLMEPVGLFNPQSESWTPYPTYELALESTGGHGVRFVNASDDRENPTYGPDAQIVFNGACRGINYFDGTRWRLWNWSQMPGSPVAPFETAAFFDPAGKLAVNVSHETWELEPRAGWRIIGYEPHQALTTNWFMVAPPRRPPAGCSESQSTSLVRDRLGRSWWTWQGNVYEGVAGLCRAAFNAGQPQPFIDGRLLRRVMIDAKGNVFFETMLASNRVGEYVVWITPGPVPKTTIHVTQLSPASVRVDFSTTAAGKSLFTWRLDGGAWSAPQAQNFTVVDNLPGGQHMVEAASIDSELRMDPVPASVTIVSSGPPPQEIVGLITQLANAANDDQREAAVRNIAAQPPAVALPALRAARAAANENLRWWIDAAIQELDQKKRSDK